MEVKPGYKRTEVGVIPEEWKTYLLEEISERVSVGLATSVTKHYRAMGVPIVRNLNIKDGFFDGSDMLFVSPEFANANAGKAAKAFDVLTVHTGSNLGQTCVLPVEFDNCQTFTTLITTPKKRMADPHFLCLHMSSEFGRNEMAMLQAGGGKGNLNTGELKKYRIVLPPLPEQRAIAEALSDVDGLLGGLDRLIAKKRDLKQAAMQQLLTGQTRLPGFHGEWEVLNMADNSTLKARIGWQGLTTAEYLKAGDYFLVTGTDFSDGRIAWSSCCFVAAERYTQDRNIQLRSKDILLTKDGTIGKVAYVDHIPGPATLNSGVFVIRPKGEAYDPRFFYFILTSRIFDEFLNKLAAGSTISHLYQKDFVTFSFLVPPTISEQTAIAEVLTEMDGELAVLEQRREKTRALKQAMMQELLTGRTRLV